MKNYTRTIGITIIVGLISITQQVSLAQTAVESTTTTTTSAGTVDEFGPHTIVVKTETSPEPVRYSYTKTTTYVDENGVPVSVKTVKSGVPVTVYYEKEGNEMVASKVIVRKTSSVEPMSNTISAGTVDEFGPHTIVIKTKTSPEPVRYNYTKTTTYVDENGAPVSVETVKSGVPVTVYYEKEGDEMVARKVIVRSLVPADSDTSTVIEHKKTTTTTKERD